MFDLTSIDLLSMIDDDDDDDDDDCLELIQGKGNTIRNEW